jgi:hypothetical protein
MPYILCEIAGCLEKADYEEHDYRPYIYHDTKKDVHCAGRNPNFKKNKMR